MIRDERGKYKFDKYQLDHLDVIIILIATVLYGAVAILYSGIL